jgi:glycosyltransferase involved in cell wall biosynthesis
VSAADLASGAQLPRVAVFDTDGANPYGREVAATLAAAGCEVEAILPADVAWIPEGVAARRRLPFNTPSSRPAQAVRLARGLLSAARAGLLERRALIVIMTRDWPDQLALAALARLGARLVVVAHDPTPKTPLTGLRAAARRALWRAASRLVAHSPALAREAEAASGRAAEVVPHLPFDAYADWCRRVAPDQPSDGRTRLLVLGQMRPDKGLERLPEIFARVPEAARARLTLAFAGRGRLDEMVARLERLTPIVRPISSRRLRDEDVAQALSECDTLLAPYPLVSASGSVVLALSRGLRVLAYDAGAICDALDEEGLVAPGDEEAMAERIAQAALGTRSAGGARTQAQAWTRRARAAWLHVARQASPDRPPRSFNRDPA